MGVQSLRNFASLTGKNSGRPGFYQTGGVSVLKTYLQAMLAEMPSDQVKVVLALFICHGALVNPTLTANHGADQLVFLGVQALSSVSEWLPDDVNSTAVKMLWSIAGLVSSAQLCFRPLWVGCLLHDGLYNFR